MTIYYDTKKIDAKDSTYNVIFGERSNGKTYALLLKSIKAYFTHGSQFAYVRRWKEDITGRRAQRLFSGVNENDVIAELCNGRFTGVHYYAGKFYLCTYDENGKTIYNDNDIIGFTFALSDGEHDKSTSFPNINTVIFDEFLTNRLYLVDEFVLFMNTVSTIVRRRENVKIYMLGNTVNKYCPYFQEMGLDKVPSMEQGTIDVYRYGDSDLKVAVEYCASIDNGKDKPSNKYFAFNNPKLEMITGGSWELNIYPHLPCKYKPKDILLIFFIEFSDNIYQCEIINVEDIAFIYIHNKTTAIKDAENHVIYSLEHKAEMNYNRNIFRPNSRIQEKITNFFKHDKVFYQDNNVGDAVNNFIKLCKRG